MRKKNGFLAVSIIFSFFIVFLMLLAINLTSYAQNRILLNQVKKDIKLDISLEVKNKKCIRAKTLHTENCFSQATNGCVVAGYSQAATITYGNNPDNVTQGVLTSGDAFDCDVNGDGVYNSETERFYYVSDLDTNSNYAVLIYYNNTVNGEADNTGTIAYHSENVNNQGPVTAKINLPTTSQWNNIALSTTSRNIVDDNGIIKTVNFSYNGYAARLLTAKELKNACGLTTGLQIPGNCEFLMENTNYQDYELKTGYWIETPVNSSIQVFFVQGENRRIYVNSANMADIINVRPAIEVLKTDISY